MENPGNMNPQELKIQGLIDRFLNVRARERYDEECRLDEDMLAAFIEGNLNRREAQIVVNNLVNCSLCRNITAELVRLDAAFAEDGVRTVANETTQPSKISEVLGGLLAKIFGNNDASVFAHQEEDDEKKEETENKE